MQRSQDPCSSAASIVVIEGNFLGTDPTGHRVDVGPDPRNNGIGGVTAPANLRVGGVTPAARNLISGGDSKIEVGNITSDRTAS